MRVVDRFPAEGFFSGSRTLLVRSLPPGARLKSFRLFIIPIADANGATGPRDEVLSFVTASGDPSDVAIDPDNPERSTGVSRSIADGPPRWTEIAFTGFRKLSQVRGSGLKDARLQVDVGGLFVGVDENGTIPAQGQNLKLSGDAADLPGLSVQRMRLMPDATADHPEVTEIRLRATGSNLTIAIGGQPAVWAHPGEVLGPIETSEVAEFAQAALAEARVENGFAVLPVTIKTDTTAFVSVDVVAEFDTTASGLPAGLSDVTLDYAHDAIADSGDDLLTLAVPDGMELDPTLTRVEIAGTFEGSEISHGPLADRAPKSSITLAEGHAAAAPLSVRTETVTNAVDLLVSTQRRNAALDIDLREDFDGKPGDVSLLSRHASASLDVSRFADPRWRNVALGQDVTLPGADPATGKPRIWVVVQAVAGSVDWHLNPATEHTAEMQTSDNGGLAWRSARVEGITGALEAGLRLRRSSPVFRVPVRAEIGRDAEAVELALDKFQPLGRMEFALDSAEFAGAVNALLSGRRAGACPRGEQLINGDFADRDPDGEYVPADWTVSDGGLNLADYSVAGLPDNETIRLVCIGMREGPAQSISQVFPVSSGCPYRLTFRGFRQSPGGRVELVWRGPDCSVTRVDTLDPPLLDTPSAQVSGASLSTHVLMREPVLLNIPAASLDARAPEGAEQVEVRVVAGPGDVIYADTVSLAGSPAGLVNPDFHEFHPLAKEPQRLRGWTFTPADASAEDGFEVRPYFAGLALANRNTRGKRLTLSQSVEASPGVPLSVSLEAVIPTEFRAGPAPGFGVVWRDGDQNAIGAPLAAAVSSNGSTVSRLAATVPDGARAAEITIELAPGSGLNVFAVTSQTQPPESVPVSFLSEAPGRLTVRDFTLGYRAAPDPAPPLFTAAPCAPTPADRAPRDVCEPDPCCQGPGKSKAGVETIAAPRPISVMDSVTPLVSDPAHAATFTSSTTPGPAPVSATARIAAIATRLSRSRFAGRDVAAAPRERFETVRAANPQAAEATVAEVHGVGDVRTSQLSTLGIRTVTDLAHALPDDLVHRLGYNRNLARDLVAKARELVETQSIS